MKGFLYWTYIVLMVIITLFIPTAILLGKTPLWQADSIIGAILAFIFLVSFPLFSFQLERTN